MINFLFKNHLSIEEIEHFLLQVFDYSESKIAIIHIDKFNDINSKIDINNLSCLCVYSEISGDASLLVQLYRYSIEENTLIEKIIKASIKSSIACYVPIDDFDGWVLSGGWPKEIKGKQIYPEKDNTFYFKSLEQVDSI